MSHHLNAYFHQVSILFLLESMLFLMSICVYIALFVIAIFKVCVITPVSSVSELRTFCGRTYT